MELKICSLYVPSYCGQGKFLPLLLYDMCLHGLKTTGFYTVKIVVCEDNDKCDVLYIDDVTATR